MAEEQVDPAEAGKAAYWSRLEEQNYREELARFDALGEVARKLGVQADSPDKEQEPTPRRHHDGESQEP